MKEKTQTPKRAQERHDETCSYNSKQLFRFFRNLLRLWCSPTFYCVLKIFLSCFLVAGGEFTIKLRTSDILNSFDAFCYVLVTVCVSGLFNAGTCASFELRELERLEVFLFLGLCLVRRSIFERLERAFCGKCSGVC